MSDIATTPIQKSEQEIYQVFYSQYSYIARFERNPLEILNKLRLKLEDLETQKIQALENFTKTRIAKKRTPPSSELTSIERSLTTVEQALQALNDVVQAFS